MDMDDIVNKLGKLPPGLVKVIEKYLNKIPSVQKEIDRQTDEIMKDIAEDLRPYKSDFSTYTEIPAEGKSREDVLAEMQGMADQDRLKTMRAYQRFDPGSLTLAEVAEVAEIEPQECQTSAGSATSAAGPAARGQWDAETAALIEWFLGTEPPDKPFPLQQAVTIVRPAHYWEYLRQDIAAGASRARGKTGLRVGHLQRVRGTIDRRSKDCHGD